MAVKYLYKYRALLEIKNGSDEIAQYIGGRYLSSSEACWRIFRYSMHHEFPNVTRLAIHLPNEQIVYFNENQDLTKLESKTSDTTLTAWFKINKIDLAAHNIVYPDFPRYYTWNKNKKQWMKRKKDEANTIGRVYMAHPSETKKYYLRMLLYFIPGATSFEELRTFNNIIMPTFKEACIAHNLLQNVTEWQKCLEEGAAIQTGRCLRQLFASILKFILLLWYHYRYYYFAYLFMCAI